MTEVIIEDVSVKFPFEPYEEQKKYMAKVIETISERKIGLLESPTGTGKTLSLLCATLAWLEKQRSEIGLSQEQPGFPEEDHLTPDDVPFGAPQIFPKIIYSSRTHSQLSKAMSELQKTSYKNFKVTILGSRDQMCVHPQVMKETNLTLKNALCSMHMKVKSCTFGNNVDKFKKDGSFFTGGIMDLEDLVSKSKKINCCPYYLARELQIRADIVFMPYNYLFDYQIRKALKISLSNAIIILDEAHNIDKVCEEASSVTIKSSDLALALTDVTKEMQAMHDDRESGYFVEREYSPDDLCFVKEKLAALEKVIDEFAVSKDESITKSGVYIFEILKNAGIDYNASLELIRLLSVIYEFMSNENSEGVSRGGTSLKKFADDLEVIFATINSSNILLADKDFRVHIEEEAVRNPMAGHRNTFKKDVKPGKVVNYWCFNPGYCLGSTVKEEVRSVIMTSGTLAPINSYAKEMQLNNPVTVECSHIVSEDQVLVLKLDSGPRNVPLKCSYANRQNADYWKELALTLQNFFRIIPDGVLLFFPGYAVLNVAVKMWKESGMWEKLVTLKPIFIEPQNKGELQQICNEYYRAIDNGNGKGAVLLGVCRGKISEGLDFSDQYGRAVLIAGLPYPPLFDPKVKLKKAYVDSNRKSNDDLSGEVWYLLEATKAVNQAIGRVIRHNKDYGAILLCDAQFNQPNIVKNLSKWVQEKVVKARNFGDSVLKLRSFYKKNNSPSPPSPTKSVQVSQPLAVQPSFGSVSSSSSKRSDLQCLENYLSRISDSASRISVLDPSPSTSSSSDSFLFKHSKPTSLTSYLRIISNVLTYYEELSDLPAPEPEENASSKSCLERLSATDDFHFDNKKSFNLLNTESLKNEDKLSVLNKMLEKLEEYKSSYPLPPSKVFQDLSLNEPEDEANSRKTEEVLTNTISRLQRLNQHLAETFKKRPSDPCSSDINFESSTVPAKRRKIKLAPIKVDDIKLSGSDEKTKNMEKRLNDTKDFLVELKTILEPQSYYSLVGLIKKFKSKDDFDETVNLLRELFPDKDEEYKSIFRRCYLLFTGQWEREFRSYCEAHGI